MRSLLFEIRNSLKHIWRDKIDYLFFILQMLIVFGAIKQIGTDLFLIINVNILLILLIVKRRLHLGSLFFTLSLLYFFIILIPILTFGFNPKLYIGFYIRLITAYFIAIYFSDKFIFMFENMIFLLAFISLPFFLIQITNINFFNIFSPITTTLLPDNLLNDPSPVGFKYIIVFLVNPGGLIRNSGFAWEPAAFGASLTWGLLFNLFLNKFKPNIRLLILIVAALTTFSVGTYVYLAVLLLLYFYEKRLKSMLYLGVALIVLILTITRVPLVHDQIQWMSVKIQNEPNNVKQSLSGNLAPQSVSRVAGFYVNIKYFLKRPLGYGFADKSPELAMVASSPNGLMHILVRWGIIGITMFLFASYKLIFLMRSVHYRQLKKISVYLSVILFIIPFTGNPFYNEPLLFAMLMLPFIKNPRKKPAQQAYVKVPATNIPTVRI